MERRKPRLDFAPEQKKPLVVEQTSAKFHNREGENRARLEYLQSLREVSASDYNRENSLDGSYIAQLYNEYYGKAAANMPDVVRSLMTKRVRGVLNKMKEIKRSGGLNSEQIELISNLVNETADKGYGYQRRELEFAFDDFVKQFKTPEDYQAAKDEGFADFSEMMTEINAAQQTDIDGMVTRLKEEFSLHGAALEKMQTGLDSVYNDALRKEYDRTRRKIAETRAMMNLLDQYSGDLEGITTFIDMAGGAGDIGVAIVDKMRDESIEARVVDVVPVFAEYAGFLAENAISEDARERLTFELHPLQETVIEPSQRNQTAIVSKHPCGGLKEDIVSLAIDNEVPFVMVMTCCQDKMCKHAEDYHEYYKDEIPDLDEFKKVAKTSARTNIDLRDFQDDPKRLAKMEKSLEMGVQAMNTLDGVTANRLRRAGYEVDMVQLDDPLIHKGNVIIARRSSRMVQEMELPLAAK